MQASLGRHMQLCRVRLAAALLQEPLCSLRSCSRSLASEQPAWPGAWVVFLEERERCDCAEDVVGGACVPLGPNTWRADLARLKHQRVQPSCPAPAKRHLCSHGRHFCVGTGSGSGQCISLP